MSEENLEENTPIEKPEWADERFWNKETNELNVEDIHKSWSHANDKMNGKKQAPESYELQFGEEVPKEYQEGFDAESELVNNLVEFSKEADLNQEQFNKILGMFAGSEVEDTAAAEAFQKAEMALLGEHASRRIGDIESWLDANLDESTSKALKDTMTTAAAIEGLEQLQSKSKAPQQPKGPDLTPDNSSVHEELKKEYLAKDEHGNRIMQDPAKLANWRERAAAANYTA